MPPKKQFEIPTKGDGGKKPVSKPLELNNLSSFKPVDLRNKLPVNVVFHEKESAPLDKKEEVNATSAEVFSFVKKVPEEANPNKIEEANIQVNEKIEKPVAENEEKITTSLEISNEKRKSLFRGSNTWEVLKPQPLVSKNNTGKIKKLEQLNGIINETLIKNIDKLLITDSLFDIPGTKGSETMDWKMISVMNAKEMMEKTNITESTDLLTKESIEKVKGYIKELQSKSGEISISPNDNEGVSSFIKRIIKTTHSKS